MQRPYPERCAPVLRKSILWCVAALMSLAVVAVPARAGVFLSELCDPLNNFSADRFIEIYNPGPGDVDLTGWSVVAIANNVDALTWSLSGTLPAGQARVCGSPLASGFTVHARSVYLCGREQVENPKRSGNVITSRL